MKSLIAAALLLALISPAHAETETCTGRVKIDVVTDNDGLYRKGDRVFNVGGCAFVSPALHKKVLRICPIGSWCRVIGPTAGDDAIESLDSVIRMPAPASEFRESDRKNLPLMDKLGDAASFCLRGNYADKRHGKVCEEMQRLKNKLEARGYCYIAMGTVGRGSGKHCYPIDFPEPEPVMKHYKTPQ